MHETILEVLMKRDNMEESEAFEMIEEAKDDLYAQLSMGMVDEAEFMRDWFGLEPDYIIELL